MTLQDARSTIQEIADAERRRRGRLAGLWATGREWLSLALAVLGARLGRRARITKGAPPPPHDRKPSMIAPDLLHAWRRVTARPGTALMAAAMLGLGVALTTAMFTLADALLLRPVPFRDPDRLALVQTRTKNSGRNVHPPALLRAWKASGIFEAVEGGSYLGTRSGTVIIDTGSDLLMRGSARVSSGLFAMLGVAPIRGRTFLPEEGRAGSDDRVLLSETVWRTIFDASPDLIGRTVAVDGRPHTVVGIMPADFRFPRWDTVVWRPIDYSSPPPALAEELPGVYVRWAQGVPADVAATRAADVMRQTDPSLAKLWIELNPLVRANSDEYYKRAVPMLAAGVVLVFLVLCANVSGLQLAQVTLRRREYSVCAALGASRARLVRQALLESGVVGIGGVALGLAGGWALVALARGFLPDAFLLQSLNPMNLDMRATLAASVAALAATVLSGVLPAWIGTATNQTGAARAMERAGTETRAARLASRTLLVVEIAMACALLSGATLLVRSFVNLAGTERGLRTDDVITSWLSLPLAVKDAPGRQALAAGIERELLAAPGVESVTLSLGLPPGGGGIHDYDDWRSDVPGAAQIRMVVSEFYVRPDFFTLYGIALLRGRPFAAGDPDTTAIVGERLARALWGDVDPVGRSFTYGKRRLDVIALAREINLPTLESRQDRPEFYTPFGSTGGQVMLSLRCAGPCPSIPVIRRRLETAHAGLTIHQMSQLADEYAAHVARPRAAAALGSAFAVVAVLAAAGGLFSVLTYAVNRRRREFGIRTAIGASPVQIRRLVVRDGAVVAAMGVALGVVAAWALGRAMTAFQYGVTPNDPLTWGLVLAVVGATTLVASWRPARQAMRVDPAKLLRDN